MKSMTTIEMKRMANETTYNLSPLSFAKKSISSVILNSRFAIVLASILSLMLSEKVSALKALRLLNALTAGVCAILFGGFSGMVQVLLLVWLGIAVWQFSKTKA